MIPPSPLFLAPFHLNNLTGKLNDQRSFVMKLRKKAKSAKQEQSPNYCHLRNIVNFIIQVTVSNRLGLMRCKVRAGRG